MVMMQIRQKAHREHQSEGEQRFMLMIDGAFFEPLKRLTSVRHAKMKKFRSCFFHCKCVVSYE